MCKPPLLGPVEEIRKSVETQYRLETFKPKERRCMVLTTRQQIAHWTFCVKTAEAPSQAAVI